MPRVFGGFLQSSGLFRLFALGDLSELHISCLDVLNSKFWHYRTCQQVLKLPSMKDMGKLRESYAGVGPTLTCFLPRETSLKSAEANEENTWVVNPPFSNTPIDTYLWLVIAAMNITIIITITHHYKNNYNYIYIYTIYTAISP